MKKGNENTGDFAFLRDLTAGIKRGLESVKVRGQWRLRCGAFLSRERRTFAKMIGSRQSERACRGPVDIRREK